MVKIAPPDRSVEGCGEHAMHATYLRGDNFCTLSRVKSLSFLRPNSGIRWRHITSRTFSKLRRFKLSLTASRYSARKSRTVMSVGLNVVASLFANACFPALAVHPIACFPPPFGAVPRRVGAHPSEVLWDL